MSPPQPIRNLRITNSIVTMLTVNVRLDKGYDFANLLIIHHAKTKKITSVREVWIPGLN